MTSTKTDPVLERFRDRYAAYKAAYPRLYLYALIDIAALAENGQHLLSDITQAMPLVSLYNDTGLDNLSEKGPCLFGCPAPEGIEPLRMFRLLLGLARQDNRVVSWLWSTHEIDPFVDHLQTLLHARLESDGADTWFFFHQPGYLPVLHRTLPDDARDYMFGPCLEWWCLDYTGALIELPGGNLPIPTARDIFSIPEYVEREICRASAPAQVLAWLQRARPEVIDVVLDMNGQLRQVAPFVERAFEYGLAEKLDQGVYAATGLLYGRQYDDHPGLKTTLTQFRSGKGTLIDAYIALGERVWREVADTARQRAADTHAQAYHAKLRELGYAALRVKVVNDTDVGKRKIELLFGGDSYRRSVTLGDVDDRGFEAATVEIGCANVPVPGTAAIVKWVGPMGSSSDEVVVTGNLPRADGEGLAIVRFSRNWRVYISMHADEPKPRE